MQTIEEYQRYTRQLEGEVKKWHDAFDASEEVNRQLAKQIDPLQRDIVRLNNENRELRERLEHEEIELEIARCSHRNTLRQLNDLVKQYNEETDKTQKEQQNVHPSDKK